MNYLDHLNCNTNNKTNIRIINGTLVLAAIRQKYLNKYYTSPYIQTKLGFTYGRFEMRAALPKGKMLRTNIFFSEHIYSGIRIPGFGKIDLIIDNMKNQLLFSVSYEKIFDIIKPLESISVEENLNDFNNYTFEWSEYKLEWIFNGRVLHKIRIPEEIGNGFDNPFYTPIKIGIHLVVGPDSAQEDYNEMDANNWKCSLLMIDFIRVYQYSDDEQRVYIKPIINNKLTSSNICDQVMPLINQDYVRERGQQ